MFERKSLKLPITLGVSMIIVIVTLIVGWILITATSANHSDSEPQSSLYWTLLTVGTLLFALVLIGVITYLTLSIKAVNLTRRQSNFIDSVTHELKSPIASLKLYLQTLNTREVTVDERKRFLQFMMDDVERLDSLINHVLDAGYTQQKGERALEEMIELGDLIRQCATVVTLRYRVPEETVQLDLEPCRVRGDRVDMVMIFRNLIDNAVKYAGDHPEVMIRLRTANNNAIVTVSDNGPGIPAEMRTKVFRRFFRTGSELQRDKPGTGLGLNIVQTLVRRFRGKIRIVDLPQSLSGTTFEVRIPGALRTARVSGSPVAVKPVAPAIAE